MSDDAQPPFPPPRLLQCGCLCTKCCFWEDDVPEWQRQGSPPCYEGEGALSKCTVAARGQSLTSDCAVYDKELCGLEYSTFEQIPWCPIPHPAAVPTYLQVRPPPTTRAEPRDQKPNRKCVPLPP